MNELKEKLRKKQNVFGTHVSLNDPSICEIIGYLGFDYIWIDMEHSCIDCKTLAIHLNAAKVTGTPVIVRVPTDDYTTVKKVLEMGVDGIVFPMIRDAEQANRLISFTLYPPVGTRGFGPLRAIRYGIDDVDNYINNHSLDICRFIQIEHKSAIDNLTEIIKNKYIDGYIFGPYDLSGSIGELGNVYGLRNTELIRNAIQILRDAGKIIGLSSGDSSAKTLQYWYDMGINMISAGADYNFILAGARETLVNLRKCQHNDK